MTKFFRQYSRFFLLVFMSVLMVVFVIGDAIGRGSSARADALDTEVGTAFGESVRDSHLRRAMADLQMAASIGLIPTPLARLEQISPEQREQTIGVYLMMREAEQLGVRVSEAQLRELLSRMQMTDEQFSLLTSRFGRRSASQVYDALGRVMSVGMFFQAQADAGLGQPLPQLEDTYRNFMQNAKVKVSVIDANAFLTEDQPDDAQLAVLFEEGKDRLDEHTAEELHFGYQLPDRVKLEWITLNPKRIEDEVTIREVDAERFYRSNPDRYRTSAEGPALDGQATILKPYEEVREQVRATVRTLKAIEEARREINLIRETAAGPWKSMPRGADGTRPAPAADQQMDLTTAIGASRFAEYIVRRETGWLTREELGAMPVLGGARMQVERQRVAAPEVIFHVEGLAGPSEESPLPLLRTGEPGPVLTSFDTRATGASEPYQPIAFRVLAVEPSGPPRTMEEVRGKLVDDWRRQRAMQRAGEFARELAEQARSVGLEQAVAEAEALRSALQDADARAVSTDGTALEIYTKRLTPIEPPRFPRFATNVSGVRSTPLHERIYELADDDSPHRVALAASPADKAWVVAELFEVEPLYQGEFDQQRASFDQRSEMSQRFRFVQLWCDYENIKARTRFVAKVTETPEDETETSQ